MVKERGQFMMDVLMILTFLIGLVSIYLLIVWCDKQINQKSQ